MSEAHVRDGEAGDLSALAAIDPQLRAGSWRERLVRDALATGACLVASSRAAGAPTAYGVFDHGFHGRGWVHLLHVAAEHRRRGLGDRLLAACEARCATPALFVSTNVSNAPMRALLARRGYFESGVVHGLDPGDPEVFHRKELGASKG